MIWILHFVIINILYFISKHIEKEKFFIISVFIYCTFVFGQRWMTGEDFPGYMLYYLINFQGVDIGYQVIQDFFVQQQLYFGLLIFIVYFITQLNFFIFILRFKKYTVLMIYLMCFLEIFFLELSQIRQWLAISFFINGFQLFYFKKKLKSFVYLTIGACFHVSLILVIPLLLFKFQLSLNKYFYFFFLCIFLPFIDVKIFFEPFGNIIYSNYIGGSYDVSLGYSHYLKYYSVLVLTIIYLLFMKVKVNENINNNIINGHLFYLFLYGLSFQFAPFMRLSYYFKIYEVVFLVYNIDFLIGISKLLIKRVVIVLIFLSYLGIAIIDPYNISNYQFRLLEIYETKSENELRYEIYMFYNQ